MDDGKKRKGGKLVDLPKQKKAGVGGGWGVEGRTEAKEDRLVGRMALDVLMRGKGYLRGVGPRDGEVEAERRRRRKGEDEADEDYG